MKQAYKIIIAFLVLIADIACMFLFTKYYHMAFWINLFFSVLAIVFVSGAIILVASREKKVFGMSLTVYALAYLVLALSTAFRTIFIPDILARKVAFFHVLYFFAFLIIFILGKAENEFIGAQQDKRSTELANFRYTLECMKNTMAKVPFDATYKKKVEHAYDSLASGQTASNPDMEDVEKAILESIKQLDEVIASKEEEPIVKACDKIEELAAERKRLLACKVNF